MLVSAISKVIHLYVYIYPLLFGAPSLLGHGRALNRVPRAVQQVLVSHLSHTQQCIYVHPNLPNPHSCPFGVYKCVLYICDSISALQISSSLPFFQIPHISDIIWNLFFSFWLPWLCMTHARPICTSVQHCLYRLTDSQSWKDTHESRKANGLIL